MTLRVFSTRLIRGLGLLGALIVLVPALRADDGVSAAGTMPEDYIPGLKAVLQAALKQSPTMVSQAMAVEQSRISVLQTDSALYPHLSIGGQYSGTKEEISEPGVLSQPSTSSGLFYNAGVSQHLFYWGTIVNASRVARIGELMAERRYADAYLSLADNIRSGFVGLIISKMSLRNARFTQRLADAQLAIAQDNLKHGVISPNAITQWELPDEDASLVADRAAEDYEHGKRLLAIEAGMTDIADSSIPDQMPRPVYDEGKAKSLLATLLSEGGRSLFQTQVYEMQIKQDKINYRNAATGLLPKVDFSAGYSLANQTSITQSFNAATNQTVGVATPVGIRQESYTLGVSWPLFDGFATRAAKMSALVTRRNDERALHDFVDAKMEQAQDLVRQLDFAARAVRVASMRYSMSVSATQEATDEFKLGNQSQASVDSILSGQYNTEVALAYAQSQFLSDWNLLVSLAGIDPALDALPIHYVRGTPP
jgi:outer membrane protein TolC